MNFIDSHFTLSILTFLTPPFLVHKTWQDNFKNLVLAKYFLVYHKLGGFV